MNNGLKIYACSGISNENRNSSQKLDYQLEGTSTLSNTRAMNIILSIMNEALSKVKYSGSQIGPDTLNQLDLYSTAFYFARLYREQPNYLQDAGYCIQQLQDAGYFTSESTDMKDHENFVSGYIEAVQNLIKFDKVIKSDGTFIRWWNEYVMGMNVVGLTKEQQEASRLALKKAVSGTDRYGIDSDSDLSQYLNNGAEYFLYYDLLSEQEAKSLSPTIYRKWKKQREVYEYCVLSFVGIYGTEETMVRIIESGIRSTFDASLEDIKNALVSGKLGNKGVGIATEIVCAIITAIVTIITALIGGLLSYAATVNASKYTAPANPDAGIAEAVDWEGTSAGNGLFKKQAGSTYLAVGLVAIALGTWWNNRKNQ